MSSSAFNRLANRAIAGFAAASVRRDVAYPPDETALLLVGPQPHLLRSADTVVALARLLAMARAAGLPVIFVPAAPPTSREGIRFPTPSQRAILVDGLLMPGSAGAEIHRDLSPRPGEVVMAPRASLSAFARTGLATRLSELHIRRIVVAGARTDVEVDSTARDAVELGLQTTIAADCCTGTSRENHRATISTTLPRIVHGVLELDEIGQRLPPHFSTADDGPAMIHARTGTPFQRVSSCCCAP
jgi:nicotinamidase-related amidase